MTGSQSRSGQQGTDAPNAMPTDTEKQQSVRTTESQQLHHTSAKDSNANDQHKSSANDKTSSCVSITTGNAKPKSVRRKPSKMRHGKRSRKKRKRVDNTKPNDVEHWS